MTSAIQPPHGFVLNVGHEAEARQIIFMGYSFLLAARKGLWHRVWPISKKMPRAICIDRMDCYPFLITFKAAFIHWLQKTHISDVFYTSIHFESK